MLYAKKPAEKLSAVLVDAVFLLCRGEQGFCGFLLVATLAELDVCHDFYIQLAFTVF
jgi:hypothetical protein